MTLFCMHCKAPFEDLFTKPGKTRAVHCDSCGCNMVLEKTEGGTAVLTRVTAWPVHISQVKVTPDPTKELKRLQSLLKESERLEEYEQCAEILKQIKSYG